MHFQGRKVYPTGNVIVVSLWGCLSFLLTYLLNSERLGIDDSDIFFTYAENLANGNGISYSNGIPRVEGYTSTLWMLLSALAFRLHVDEMGVLIITLLLFIGTHLIGFKILERVLPRDSWVRAKSFYLIAVMMSLGYSSWMLVSFMDTTVWGFSLMAVCRFLIATPTSQLPKTVGSLLFALLPLVRPEALVIVPIILCLLLFVKRDWFTKQVLWVAIPFAISSVILTMFRLYYFGFPLPNTFYAKVSGSVIDNVAHGLFYVGNYVQSVPFALVALVILLALLLDVCFRRIGTTASMLDRNLFFDAIKPQLVLCFVLLSSVLSVILGGGDHFRLFRLLQPSWPLAILLLTISWVTFSRELWFVKRSFVVVITTISFLLAEFLSTVSGESWTAAIRDRSSPISHEFEIAEAGRQLGKNLNLVFADLGTTPSIGTITAGGIARTYRGTIFDLMGLNNREMAHESRQREGFRNHAIFDKEVFFRWSVDVVISTPYSWGMDVALKGLATDVRFMNKYKFGYLYHTQHPKVRIKAYFEESFLARIADNPNLVYVAASRF
jgi:arabinofuranosyltransferase